ncbi:protein of unknown function [Methylocaldum szegediense]|uniref:Uncharacterized protein n=1 Tax=Methylocaldum szegediense TaxID=73780 RepID=A0ABM9I961_9GAMM|nr:protein of unknown function [Methylocaldum szegediense]
MAEIEARLRLVSIHSRLLSRELQLQGKPLSLSMTFQSTPGY